MGPSPDVDPDITLVNRKQTRQLSVFQPSEDGIQCAFIAWCRLQRDERRFTYHIPNEGRRFQPLAVRRGLRPGVSDNFIPAARAGWQGLYLELKARDKKPTPEQAQFGLDMNTCGYAWAWADTLDEAMAITERYMAGGMPRPNWVHYAAPAKVP